MKNTVYLLFVFMLSITLAYASDASCRSWCQGRHLNNAGDDFVCCHSGHDDNADWLPDDCICHLPCSSC
ncbi:unnamed protein product [Cunninghamella echinulata]